MTYLRSDRFGVHDRRAVAFGKKIASLGEDTILKAAGGDGATYTIGCFFLWNLDDLVSARPYLEQAAASGVTDALIDLLVIALFSKAI